MRKKHELADPNSCLSRTQADEMTFVLLGRHPAAAVAIRAWINERIRIGKNQPGDSQVTEAEGCARTMDNERNSKLGLSKREQLPSEDSTFLCPQCGGDMWMPNDPYEPFWCENEDCCFETHEMPKVRFLTQADREAALDEQEKGGGK